MRDLSGKEWNLVNDFGLYKHSSAGFYLAIGSNAYKLITRVEDIKAGVL
jgi:hypothetical protein